MIKSSFGNEPNSKTKGLDTMTHSYEDHPNHPFMQAEDTFWGIELEVTIPSRNWGIQATGWSQRQGNQIPHYPQGWKATLDGSISAPPACTAVEIVSPKLKGFDGVVQIVQVLDDLNERGATVNSTCGIHIHVDGNNLDIRDIKKVKQMYVQYEKLFFGVLGDKAAQRYQNSFCKPSNRWNDYNDENDKYRSLNLVNWYSFERKKTVEFRLFSGEGHNLNPENIVTYVMMSVGLVVRSRNCTRVHSFTKPVTDLKDLCKKFVSNCLSKKTNQIVPDYTSARGDSLYKVLYENIPQSTVGL